MHRSTTPRSTRRSSLAALAALLAVACLVVASCGTSGGASEGSKKDDSSSSDSSEDKADDASDETTTTAADDPGDEGDPQARAESIDLELSDFPEGFTAEPPDTSDEPSPLDECDPSFTDDSGELATFTDSTFTLGKSGDGVRLRAETKVFEDEATAEAALEPFADPEVLSCIDTKLKDIYEADGGTMSGSFSPGDYGDTSTDRVVAAIGDYTYTSPDGATDPVGVGVVIFRTGDLATQIVLQGEGPTLDAVDVSDVLSRVEELQTAS